MRDFQSKILREHEGPVTTAKKQKKKKYTGNGKKQLHDQFLKEMKEVSREETGVNLGKLLEKRN